MTILSDALKVKSGRPPHGAPPTAEELDAAIACASGEVSYKQLGAVIKKSQSLTHLWVGAILKRAVACGMLVRKEQ